MSEKGKAALEHLKKTKDLEAKFKEELYKFEHKKNIKNEEIIKSHLVAQNYREALEKKNDNEISEDDNIYYKINQAFHNMGNKIDYSTTRFHNINIIRHEQDVDDFISAQEKALKEVERTQYLEKTKSSKLKKFNSEVKVNSLEVMKKMKAKENLKKLEEELNKINEIRKKSKVKNTMYKFLIKDSRKSYYTKV